MKKEVLFVHSAGPQGYHEGSDYLVSYLRHALGGQYKVLFPMMPDPENPTYASWKAQLKKEITAIDNEAILIGHSLGASVLLKFLTEEQLHKSIAGLFLIGAVYWGKENWEVTEYELHENFMFNLPPIPQIYLYHSRDDQVVPVTHLMYYADALPMATIREFENRGHLFGKGLPELAEDIKRLKA